MFANSHIQQIEVMGTVNSFIQIKHLYSRATFGISYTELQKKQSWTINRAVSQLLDDSKDYESLDITAGPLNQRAAASAMQLTEEQKKDRLREARQKVRLLNTSWLALMASSRAQLREKLTLLWHGHFACRSVNAAFLEELNNIHRKHALGNFKSMLLEVSKAPAMLQFLNNQQNRKGKPNENFARELMELFTIGRGNYSETDVKEAARAFTGWGFNQSGQFQFRPFLHDDDEKTFFEKSGNFDGTDIIDMLLAKPETADFVTRKLYLFLVGDSIQESRVKELGAYFYKSDYDSAELVKKILTADWFYEPSSMGTKIKSPVELLVGINRQFNVKYENPDVLLKFQGALGQIVFYPPNVAGWPGGKNWIDSSSLMVRLKIPSLILNAGIIDFDGKGDIEDEAIIALDRMKRTAVERQVKASADWEGFLARLPRNISVADLADFLLQRGISANLMKAMVNNPNLKSVTIELLSLPEYQMC